MLRMEMRKPQKPALRGLRGDGIGEALERMTNDITA